MKTEEEIKSHFCGSQKQEEFFKKYSKPNFKLQFEKLGATISSTTIANSLPKITINKNSELQKKLNIFLEKNNFLNLLQQIEKLLYCNGKIAVGLYKTKFNEIPEIRIAKIIDYEYKNFELNKLSVIVDKKTKGRFVYNIIESWDLDTDKNYMSSFSAQNDKLKSKVELDWLDPKYQPTLNTLNFIPFVIFNNKEDSKPDLELVDKFLWDLLNIDWELLMRDPFLSAPWLFKADDMNEINIWNLDDRIQTRSDISSMYENLPVNLVQAAPQSQFILQKIDKTINLIKEFSMFKKDSSNLGTKNLQTTEAQNINSNFEDYVEAKANLREKSLKQLILIWLRFTELIAEENLNEFSEQIEIVVSGSTKWLQEEAKKYEFNTNGQRVSNFNQPKEEKEGIEDGNS